jgi:hypothetical protein
MTTTVRAGGGDVAAGLIGGLAAGTIIGAAVAGPRYYTPPPPGAADCGQYREAAGANATVDACVEYRQVTYSDMITDRPMTAEQAATLKRLAEAAYELEAFQPNITRAEADLRIAMLTAKLKLLDDPPHTL